jgi:predicted transcriptional regulator
LMSLRPQFAALIFQGKKLYEFRRRSVSLKEGDVVLVYESSPKSRVTGQFRVGNVIYGKPSTLLQLETRRETRRLCADYLAGSKKAAAIEIINPIQWKDAFSLKLLCCKISPPQSYIFIRECCHGLLCNLT